MDKLSLALGSYRAEIDNLENRRPPVGTRMSYEADALKQQRLDDLIEFVGVLEKL